MCGDRYASFDGQANNQIQFKCLSVMKKRLPEQDWKAMPHAKSRHITMNEPHSFINQVIKSFLLTRIQAHITVHAVLRHIYIDMRNSRTPNARCNAAHNVNHKNSFLDIEQVVP